MRYYITLLSFLLTVRQTYLWRARGATARSGGTARAQVSKGHVIADKQVREETLIERNSKYAMKSFLTY